MKTDFVLLSMYTYTARDAPWGAFSFINERVKTVFEVGDVIVYGSSGVCRVNSVAPSKDRAEKGRLYYELRPVFRECTIYTPADNQKVFMRPVISREDAEAIIDEIPSIRAESYHNRVLRQLAEHYEEVIRSHDCRELLRMLMSLYRKKLEMEAQKRKFGLVDERYMKRAEELLHGELAVALGLELDEVLPYIQKRVDAMKE